MDLTPGEVLLCEFYFSDFQTSKRRPVIVFKDNLPFDDFVGIPVSSQTLRLYDDEFILEPSDMALGALPKRSKIMVRKTFVISRQVIVKKYGQLSDARFQRLHEDFCHFFGCCS
jgi:mRNA interferase MazF